MRQFNVTAETRTEFGKNAARKLRRAGKVPAVLYGHKEETLALSLNPKELLVVLHSATGHNSIFSLDIQDGPSTSVMVKDWQYDPLQGNLLHADLLRIAMDETLQVNVPITTTGEAKGVKEQGGIFEFVLREVQVECLPAEIPENITIDISKLEIGSNLRVSDLPLDKIKILSDPNLVIAHVIAPKEEKAPEVIAEQPAAAEPEVIKKGKVATEEAEGEEAKSEEKKEKK
jgi:large subunit ribosomal protein L25